MKKIKIINLEGNEEELDDTLVTRMVIRTDKDGVHYLLTELELDGLIDKSLKRVIDLENNEIIVSKDITVVTRKGGIHHLQTDAEKAQRVQDQVTHERVVGEKLIRDMKKEQVRVLDATDKMMTEDAPITTEKKEEFKVYRQAIRQINNDHPDGEGIVWPVMPVKG